MEDLEIEPLIHEYAADIREALGLDPERPARLDFEDADGMLQALFLVAAELQLGTLALRPDDVSIMRFLTAVYGKSTELALSLFEEHVHRRAVAGTDDDEEDEDE